ncbi:MAG: hypothetical protein V2A72_00445 [Candidatus Omnitrophota bacterium]
MLSLNLKNIIKKIWYKKVRKLLEVLVKWGLPAGISFIILLLQFSPILYVSRVISGPDKIYFYVQNTGNIPAYCVEGGFIITSNAEPSVQKTSKEKVISANSMNTRQSVIFYPTGKSSAGLILMYPVDFKKIEELDFIFLSIYFKYPQFKLFPFFPKHIYEGVFQYDKENKSWVTSSQTMYPEFFTKIFNALRTRNIPEFALGKIPPKEEKMVSKFISLTPITIGEVLGFIGTLILASIAIFQDKMRSYVSRPKLKAHIFLSPPDCHRIPVTNRENGKHICNGFYFRFRIENYGNSVAEKVEVFAKSLKRRKNGKLIPVELFLPMNFVWAYVGGMYFPAIAPAMYKHCDLGHILDPQKRQLIDAENKDVEDIGKALFSFEQIVKSNNKGYLIEPGEYILEIKVAAFNARPILQKFELQFTGLWTENEKEMLGKEVSIRSC